MTYRTHTTYKIIPTFLVFGFWFLVFAPQSAQAIEAPCCVSGDVCLQGYGGDEQLCTAGGGTWDEQCDENPTTETCRAAAEEESSGTPTPIYGAAPVLPPIPQGTAPLRPVDPFCFTKEECQAKPYRGIPSEQPAPECLAQDNIYVKAGITYNCFAQQKPYKLQVPFLSPIFKDTTKSLEDYISTLYQLLIALSGVVAGIMIVWAGVKWLTAAGSPDRISDARHKIGNALIGLILVLSSYVILQTINPDLVHLRVPPVKLFRQSLISSGEECNRRPEFLCGITYDCNDLRFVSKGNFPCQNQRVNGMCQGRSCGQGQGGQQLGCFDVMGGRFTDMTVKGGGPKVEGTEVLTLRAYFGGAFSNDNNIINKSFCLPKQCPPCNRITNIKQCASTACQCVVTIEKRKIVCRDLGAPGTSCSTNAQCKSGSCNLGAVPDQCGPSEDGTACLRDKDCEHVCNTEELAINQMGFKAGTCMKLGSVQKDDDCDRQSLCAPGLICTNTLGGVAAGIIGKECKKL